MDGLKVFFKMRRLALPAAYILTGFALGAVAIVILSTAAPKPVAYAQPGYEAPRGVLPVSVAMPYVLPGFVAYEPPATSPQGDGGFEAYEYH